MFLPFPPSADSPASCRFCIPSSPSNFSYSIQPESGVSEHGLLYVLQADPTSVRAATRAATCYLKMGQLAEASQILDTVKATVTALGQTLPPELITKQDDLEVTKRLISQVVLR